MPKLKSPFYYKGLKGRTNDHENCGDSHIFAEQKLANFVSLFKFFYDYTVCLLLFPIACEAVWGIPEGAARPVSYRVRVRGGNKNAQTLNKALKRLKKGEGSPEREKALYGRFWRFYG